MLIRNPLIWLRRVRHRCGYGIHSPFAFNLVTEVLYSHGEYYADQKLSLLLPTVVRRLRLRPLAIHRLLFRLANHWQPGIIAAPGLTPAEWNYLHEGCHHAVIDNDMPRGQADMLLLHTPRPDWAKHISESSLLVITDLRHNLPFWKKVLNHPATRVTFDLYDVGLAIFNPKLNKQDYIINW